MSTFVRDLQESITAHLLHPRKGVTHELEQFFRHNFQHLPVQLEEARILAHHIHHIAGHHGLVFLASDGLGQLKQVSQKLDEKFALFGLVQRTANRPCRPANRVEVLPDERA